jgi:hypothetical protein
LDHLEIQYGVPNQAYIEYILASRMGLGIAEIRQLSSREVTEYMSVMNYLDAKARDEMKRNE